MVHYSNRPLLPPYLPQYRTTLDTTRIDGPFHNPRPTFSAFTISSLLPLPPHSMEPHHITLSTLDGFGLRHAENSANKPCRRACPTYADGRHLLEPKA